MTNGNGGDGWIQWATERWNVLANGAVFIMGIIGTFLLLPPDDVTKGNEQLLNLARFVVAVILGLMLVPILKWRRKRYVWSWWGVAAGALALGLIALFSYNYLTKRWTCTCFQSDPLVIGTEATLTQHGRDAISQSPRPNCHDLLEDNQCNAEVTWTKDSIEKHRLILSACYLGCILLFTVCIAAVIQSSYCMNKT